MDVNAPLTLGRKEVLALNRPAPFIDILSSSPYPQPENLLVLIGQVSRMKAEERQQLAHGVEIPLVDRLVSMAGGLPYPERLEQLWTDYYSHAQENLRTQQNVGSAEALQYGASDGNLRMRRWAGEDITKLTGVTVEADEILTTPGLQYGISDAILTLCTAENKVLITSNPTYAAALDAAENPIDTPTFSVESDVEGMIPEKLDEMLTKLDDLGIEPGLVYAMVIGNPAGEIMSDERGRQLNEVCKKHQVPFFVDHAYYKLMLKSRDGIQPHVSYLDENVILGFTTSKMASPGKRVAYMAVKDPHLRNKLKNTKQAQMILSSPTNELEFWQLANQDGFEEQVDYVREVYEEGIITGLEAVAQNKDVLRIDQTPGGGMFLYVRVPEGLSTNSHLGEILERYKIAYSPGIWSQPWQIQLPETGEVLGVPRKDNYMRLCVVTESPETITRSINKLAHAFREIAAREGIDLFTKPSVDTGIPQNPSFVTE